MKVGNKLLNRIVAVGMLAVVLFCTFSLPNPVVAHASTNNPDGSFKPSEKYDCLETRYDFRVLTARKFLNFNGNIVTFNNPSGSNCIIYISEKENSLNCTRYDYRWNNVDDYDMSESSSSYDPDRFTVNDKTYYIFVFVSNYGLFDEKPYYSYSGLLGHLYSVTDPSFNVSYSENWRKLLTDYFNNSLDSSYVVDVGEAESTDPSTWQGSRENPFDDSNIGTLLLDRSKCYWTGGGEQPTVQRISWKNKTDTGFSLNNNKYALTRIEVKIGNRVTYFGDVEHHGTGKEVDNFGKVYPFKYVNSKDNPYDFSFTEMLTASQTDLEKYNPAMLEHEYDLYFRVICSDAIGTSAKYYVGKWTRYRCTDDPKQKGDNESDDGHFDENGEWKKDKDTDVDSGGIGNVKDEDEKNDDFNNFTDSENWKDWLNEGGLDLDSAKAFISQIAEVPKMIGDIFSFLPKWVLYSFAFGFGLIPVVIVIKFLRG